MSHVVITGPVVGAPKPFTFAESGKRKLEIRVLDGGLHHTCIAWDKAAEIDLAEGDIVLCTDGRIGYRSYEKDGVKVWVTEFTFQRIEKLGSLSTSSVEPDNGSTGDLGF